MKAVESAKLLEEVTKDKMEFTRQHYEEIEGAEKALNKVQTTYQTQLNRIWGASTGQRGSDKEVKGGKAGCGGQVQAGDQLDPEYFAGMERTDEEDDRLKLDRMVDKVDATGGRIIGLTSRRREPEKGRQPLL